MLREKNRTKSHVWPPQMANNSGQKKGGNFEKKKTYPNKASYIVGLK
jgi:hypothetical protein